VAFYLLLLLLSLLRQTKNSLSFCNKSQTRPTTTTCVFSLFKATTAFPKQHRSQ
jgi:hypothetical protein